MNLSEVKHLPKVDHTPAELDEPSRLLLRAAALIEEKGLCQSGPFVDSDGRICFQCALKLGLGLGAREMDVPDVWHQANQRMSVAVGHAPFLWIERRDVTQEQVLSKMRSVALGIA